METKKIIYPILSEDGKRVVNIELEVTVAVANVLEESDKKVKALRKQDKRRLDSAGYVEGETEFSVLHNQPGLDDLAIELMDKRQLYTEIQQLPAIQRRRVTAYYLKGMTYQQIAAKEHAALSSFYESINLGLQNLRKKFGM